MNSDSFYCYYLLRNVCVGFVVPSECLSKGRMTLKISSFWPHQKEEEMPSCLPKLLQATYFLKDVKDEMGRMQLTHFLV